MIQLCFLCSFLPLLFVLLSFLSSNFLNFLFCLPSASLIYLISLLPSSILSSFLHSPPPLLHALLSFLPSFVSAFNPFFLFLIFLPFLSVPYFHLFPSPSFLHYFLSFLDALLHLLAFFSSLLFTFPPSLPSFFPT